MGCQHGGGWGHDGGGTHAELLCLFRKEPFTEGGRPWEVRAPPLLLKPLLLPPSVLTPLCREATKEKSNGLRVRSRRRNTKGTDKMGILAI